MINVSEAGISLSVSLREYREVPQCPACGFRADHWWRRFLRALRGKKPKSVVAYRFCRGSKPPSEENTNLWSAMWGGDRTIINECAGLEIAHLHATCSHCGAKWFSETKEAS